MENTLNIEYINIISLFNKRDVIIDLKNLVNIFVGINGCGKTTTLKILKGIFTDNLKSLSNIEFKEIQVKFKDEEVAILKREELFSWSSENNGISTIKKLLNKYKTKEKVLFLSNYRQFENHFVINSVNTIDFVIDSINTIESEVESYINICQKFLYNKKLIMNKDSEGNIDIKILDKDSIIRENDLSDGEKQILSIFSKLYFKEKKDIILLIDEPEISLSINWQKELIPNIVKSKKCSLIVAMTHSPFIFENEFFEKCTREL